MSVSIQYKNFLIKRQKIGDVTKFVSHLLVHNGNQKLAFAEIRPTKSKIGEAIFVNFFLFLEADHFCHNLFFYCLFSDIALLNAANSCNDNVSPRRFGSIPAVSKLFANHAFV